MNLKVGMVSLDISLLSLVRHSKNITRNTLSLYFSGCLFSIYVTCPNKYIDLVIDDTKSFCCVRQSDRLMTCITRALTKALAETANTTKLSTIRSNINILECRETKDKDLKEPVNYGSTRIVSGSKSKRISAVQDEISQTSEGLNKNTSSPFSRAFLESDQNSMNIHKAHHVIKRESFGFIKSSESNISSMQWTRSRLRALDEDLKNLLGNQDSSYRGLKLTKSMMSSCQFIGQVDSKYILVQMDGIICAIDQHAADERIGLERLERLIESKIEGKSTPSVKLSKMEQRVDSSDLLKSVVLEPRQEVQLSSSQMSTVLSYENLLKKWYFDFDFVDRGQKLILKSVPGIYDKVSTAKDFTQFIQVLSTRTSDASCCKPAFFARALASLACRYAIMFGESLNTERCVEIILSLTKCDLSFICAHGRPSIVPLLEMNDLDKNIFRSDVNMNTLPLRLRTPENDPYYGVQNRDIGSGKKIIEEAYF
jgi:DNA mismatch repair ATPase MutL